MPAPKGHEPYPGCESGGRPKKYTDTFIEKEAEAFLEWMQKPDSIWYKDFALERGYSPELLSIWAKTHEKFSQVYEVSQHWQQSRLIKGGLLSQYNPTITKLVLANTCGWTDRTQVGGNASNPLGCVLNCVDGTTKDLVHG